jgi:hypothetical protein
MISIVKFNRPRDFLLAWFLYEGSVIESTVSKVRLKILSASPFSDLFKVRIHLLNGSGWASGSDSISGENIVRRKFLGARYSYLFVVWSYILYCDAENSNATHNFLFSQMLSSFILGNDFRS